MSELLVTNSGPPFKDQALIAQETAALCLILSRWAQARPSHLASPVNLERELSKGGGEFIRHVYFILKLFLNKGS